MTPNVTQPPTPSERGVSLGHRSRHGGADQIPLPQVQGGLWLCGKHFLGPDPEDAMQQVMATTVVCLTQRAELEHRYPNYVEWLLAQSPSRVIWFPIPDLGAPSLERMLALLADLRLRLAANEVLLVHCGAGIGRAGTIAVALLITLGADHQQALDIVANHRPMAGPEAGAQRELLSALAATASSI